MLLTAVTSGTLVLLAPIWPQPHAWVVAMTQRVSFERLVLHGLLSLLLFAGASLLDLAVLREQELDVALLAFAGTVLSIVGIGVLTFLAVLRRRKRHVAAR